MTPVPVYGRVRYLVTCKVSRYHSAEGSCLFLGSTCIITGNDFSISIAAPVTGHRHRVRAPERSVLEENISTSPRIFIQAPPKLVSQPGFLLEKTGSLLQGVHAAAYTCGED